MRHYASCYVTCVQIVLVGQRWTNELTKSESEEKWSVKYERVVEELKEERMKRKQAEDEAKELRAKLELVKVQAFDNLFAKLAK